jgi:hypothetical protein
MKKGNVSSVIVERLQSGCDILQGLNELIRQNHVTAADFTAIGAVRKAVVGYFIGQGQYSTVALDGPLEIVSCVGNISLKENQPFVHAHISLANSKANVYGGHLLPGCIVGATFEVTLHVHDTDLTRTHDPETGLFLLDI